MRYLGGKSRLAKEIAAIVAPKGVWWEPFCGGLSVSVQLAKYGPGVVSDANPALIALYQAVREGWEPPPTVSKEQWEAAKTLPNTDPFKAFAAFGSSFGGMWFSGYAAPKRHFTRTHPNGMNQDYAGATRKALLKDIPALGGSSIACLSFFDLDPQTFAVPEAIYCDPPYAGTTGYDAVGAFDHGRFWAYCQEWAARGVRVFVSEYTCPVAGDVLWEKSHGLRVGGGEKAQSRTERLFLVKAPSVARVA